MVDIVRSCLSKRRYETSEKAEQEGNRFGLFFYYCRNCCGFHLTKVVQHEVPKLVVEPVKSPTTRLSEPHRTLQKQIHAEQIEKENIEKEMLDLILNNDERFSVSVFADEIYLDDNLYTKADISRDFDVSNSIAKSIRRKLVSHLVEKKRFIPVTKMKDGLILFLLYNSDFVLQLKMIHETYYENEFDRMTDIKNMIHENLSKDTENGD